MLKTCFKDRRNILEIGSGTGQHAVYFSSNLPHVIWHTSDRRQYHKGILCWIAYADPANVRPPLTLDVSDESDWHSLARSCNEIDGVFTANTCHIMSRQQVRQMFTGVGDLLGPDGVFAVYGPFNKNGRFTSRSNRQFDRYLKRQDDAMGVRNDIDIAGYAESQSLAWIDDIQMPANNRMLIFQKD